MLKLLFYQPLVLIVNLNRRVDSFFFFHFFYGEVRPNKETDQTGDLFLESSGNFSDPESCFAFAGFAVKIKFQ